MLMIGNQVHNSLFMFDFLAELALPCHCFLPSVTFSHKNAHIYVRYQKTKGGIVIPNEVRIFAIETVARLL